MEGTKKKVEINLSGESWDMLRIVEKKLILFAGQMIFVS